MLHLMGDEYMSVFMAIRTITQHPLKYFMAKKNALWDIMSLEYPEMRGKIVNDEQSGILEALSSDSGVKYFTSTVYFASRNVRVLLYK